MAIIKTVQSEIADQAYSGQAIKQIDFMQQNPGNPKIDLKSEFTEPRKKLASA